MFFGISCADLIIWLRNVFYGGVMMNDAGFRKQLDELIKEMDCLPSPQKKKLTDLAKQTTKSHKQLRDKMNALQQSLDYLRVSVKYLLFDLEATKRENAHYKKMLEDNK